MGEIMNYVSISFIGLCAGAMVAAGLFAFIVTLGLINKTASILGTAKYIDVYEYMVILGAIVWNIVYIFEPQIGGDIINFGYIGTGFIGLFFGIYVGLLATAIAEVTKVMPILSLRLKWYKGIQYIIIATALGKVVGSLIGLCYK